MAVSIRPSERRSVGASGHTAEQRTCTFARVGYEFNIHDTMILEGAGAIQDRTKEHLGYTDRPIIAARRSLLAAARDPDATNLPALPKAGRYDKLATIDTVTAPDDWRTGWIAKHLDRRRASSWASEIQAVKLGAEYA